MMVMRFMTANSTGTIINGYMRIKCVERSHLGIGLRRSEEAREVVNDGRGCDVTDVTRGAGLTNTETG